MSGGWASKASSAAPHHSPSLALLPEPSPPHPPHLWKNCLPWNQSLVPKRLGTAALEGGSSPVEKNCRWGLYFFFNIYLFGCIGSQLRHTGSSVAACGIQFPDQDRTRVPCIGSTESQPLDRQGNPRDCIFRCKWQKLGQDKVFNQVEDFGFHVMKSEGKQSKGRRWLYDVNISDSFCLFALSLIMSYSHSHACQFAVARWWYQYLQPYIHIPGKTKKKV